MPRQTLLKIRRDVTANWVDVVLAEGEFGYDTTTKQLKIGDGSTVFQSLGGINADLLDSEHGFSYALSNHNHKLDDLTAPDDNTDLNVSTSKHGLCPKLSNDATEYLNGVGTWTDAPHRASITRQAIYNGNFDIWQRGTSNTYATGTHQYLADGWRLYGSPDGGTAPTITQSRQTVTPGELIGSRYFYRITTDGAGSSFGSNSLYIPTTYIENGVRLLCGSGKKVTLSFKARSSIANKRIGVILIQHYGSGGSPSSSNTIVGTNWTLTSSWTEYSYTFDTVDITGKTFGTNENDTLTVIFYVVWGSGRQSLVGASTTENFVGAGNIDLAQVQLCAGDVALPFEPKSYHEELRQCQRYYYQPPNSSSYTRYAWGKIDASGAIAYVTLEFPVVMRADPTLSYSNLGHFKIYTMGSLYTPTGLTLDHASKKNYTINAAYSSGGLTAGSYSELIQDSTDDAILGFEAELRW